MSIIFADFQSTGTSLVSQDCWQMMASSLVGILIIFLRILGWIPSSPTDPCVPKWCSRLLIIFPQNMGTSFCCLSMSSGSGGRIPGEQLVLLLHTEAKKTLSTTGFSLSFVTMLPFTSNKGWRLLKPSFCC